MQPSRSSLLEIIKAAATEEELRESVVYIIPNIKAAETVLVNRKPFTTELPCVLLFIDLEPYANWSHKCRYLLVDKDGKVQLKQAGQYPPDTEKLQLFLKPASVQEWMLLTDKLYG